MKKGARKQPVVSDKRTASGKGQGVSRKTQGVKSWRLRAFALADALAALVVLGIAFLLASYWMVQTRKHTPYDPALNALCRDALYEPLTADSTGNHTRAGKLYLIRKQVERASEGRGLFLVTVAGVRQQHTDSIFLKRYVQSLTSTANAFFP